MSEEKYKVTIAEAIELWDCLESMETKSHVVDIKFGYRKKSNGHYLFWTGTHRYKAHEDEMTVHPEALSRLLCTITLKSFGAEIEQLLEKQKRVQQFKRLKALSPLFSSESATEDEIKRAEKLAQENEE